MTERSDLRKELAEEEKASDEAYADLKAAPEPKPSYLLQRYDECRQRVLRLQDRIAFKGAVGGALADLLAQPLPGALESTYQGNQEEKDRQQHPSCVRTWTSLPQQARARFRETDVQEVSYRTYDLDNLANLQERAFITSEGESNRLLGRAIDRINVVLDEQPDTWNLVVTTQASVQATASTDEEEARLVAEGLDSEEAAPLAIGKEEGRRQKDTVPDFCAIRKKKVRRRYMLFTIEGKLPFRMRGVALCGLVKLWNQVVDLLRQGKSMKSALQSAAFDAALSMTAVKNAIHCLGQCYKYLSERGHAYGALSDYQSTWLLYADRKGTLLVSDAISCEQTSEPDSLSVTEALFFAVLAAHDEDLTGQQQPYPAAVQPGQAPRSLGPITLEDSNIAAPPAGMESAGASWAPNSLTACAASAVADISLADLHLSSPIARQTYFAMLGGRKVVVRMGFTPKQHGHVNTEASALKALHAVQGHDVPILLAHGCTREGFAYVVTEYIDGHAWDASSAADRGLGSQLRAALGRIHQHGIVQNDVKPDNIIVERATGRPLFVDFALARPTLDPEEYVSEDSELHAMLAQADPGWLPKVVAARKAWTAREAYAVQGNIHAAATSQVPGAKAAALNAFRPEFVHRSTPWCVPAKTRPALLPMHPRLQRGTLWHGLCRCTRQ